MKNKEYINVHLKKSEMALLKAIAQNSGMTPMALAAKWIRTLISLQAERMNVNDTKQ